MSGICCRTMPGPLSCTPTLNRSAEMRSMWTQISGRMPASSQASRALSTASFTVVRRALRGLSKPSRWRFLAKNSLTEISFWLAAIDCAVARRRPPLPSTLWPSPLLDGASPLVSINSPFVVVSELIIRGRFWLRVWGVGCVEHGLAAAWCVTRSRPATIDGPKRINLRAQRTISVRLRSTHPTFRSRSGLKSRASETGSIIANLPAFSRSILPPFSAGNAGNNGCSINSRLH